MENAAFERELVLWIRDMTLNEYSRAWKGCAMSAVKPLGNAEKNSEEVVLW